MLNTNLSKKNVLIIGRGGRETAILKKTLQSPLVAEVYVAPGNAQTGKLAQNVAINETEIMVLLEFAKNKEIDLTIVGPESSLEVGVVDLFLKNNLLIFGPTKKATQIESSKTYAKNLMTEYEIPTAKFATFTNYEQALAYTKTIDYPHVIKYDGLAAGKGVVICETEDEMAEQLKMMLKEKKYGNSAVILEAFLSGEEFSVLAFVHQTKVYPLATSRDYKRAFDHDLGPNTGGMGAVCPHPNLTEIVEKEAHEIMAKTAKALVAVDNSFTGILYGGFMATENGVQVIEYNARFGDPETEVVLRKLNSDLIDVILRLLNNENVTIENDDLNYVGVTLTAKGYPREYRKGFKLENSFSTDIDHMGTMEIDNEVVATGGRVLFVSASGETLELAKNKAYDLVEKTTNKNIFYRNDIGG